MKKKRILLIVSLVLIIAIITIYFTKKVDVSEYKIINKKIPKEFNNYKIVQLSDFHGRGYNNTTKTIINKVKEINPDIIVMTGDMLDSDVEFKGEFKELINSLAIMYPIYYIDGNHEDLAEILESYKYESVMNELRNLGVTIVKDGYVKIEKENSSINLYGIDIPLDGPTGLYVRKEQLEDNYIKNVLSEINLDEFNILLSHNPLFIEQYSEWGTDLVLSGHMHGGIVRIPIINVGIASPEGEYFPKYDAGKFKVNDTIMIVNRGLGTGSINLRVFNKPEISVIVLKSKRK